MPNCSILGARHLNHQQSHWRGQHGQSELVESTCQEYVQAAKNQIESGQEAGCPFEGSLTTTTTTTTTNAAASLPLSIFARLCAAASGI